MEVLKGYSGSGWRVHPIFLTGEVDRNARFYDKYCSSILYYNLFIFFLHPMCTYVF